jgi:hypothetical protein
MFQALFSLLTSPRPRTLLLSNIFKISLGLWEFASSLRYATLQPQNRRPQIPCFEKLPGSWISTKRQTCKNDVRFCRAFCQISTALVYQSCLWRRRWSSSRFWFKLSVLWEVTPKDTIRNICQDCASDARCGDRAELCGFTIKKYFFPHDIWQFQKQSRWIWWFEEHSGVLYVIKIPKQDAVCLSPSFFLSKILNPTLSKFRDSGFMSV